MPRVSLTMPTYNGARFLREAIDSILDQTFSDIELQVVVDGSTDETLDVLATYRDPRVVVIHKQKNEGLPAAINTGLDAANGEYWAWTSDDNVHLPGALKAMVEFLDGHPESAIVSPHMLLLDEAGRTTATSDDLNCFLCRRSAAIAAGKFRTEYMLVEDVDFFLRMRHKYGPIPRIQRPYYKFRVHPASLSSTQIQKRQLVSVRLHYDLITRGIEPGSLRDLFFDRIRVAAIYRSNEYVDGIVDFARERGVPFEAELVRAAAFYKTPIGWLLAKARIAVGRRVEAQLRRLRPASTW